MTHPFKEVHKKATEDNDDDVFSPIEQVLLYFLKRAGYITLIAAVACYFAWSLFFK